MAYDSLFIGMSGLATFEGALKVVSNNIANMNTAGFKRSQLQFADLIPQRGFIGQEGGQHVGNGVTMLAPLLDLGEGSVQKTGNPLDAAISGDGFFVSRKDGVTHYSRSGQFEFDKEGFLVSRTSGYRIAGYAENGAVTDISIDSYRATPAKATGEIKFKGNIPPGSTEYVFDQVTVIDSLGAAHTLKLTFTKRANSGPSSVEWDVKVTEGVTEVDSQFVLSFIGGGLTAVPSTHTIAYRPAGTEALELTLDFSLARSQSLPGEALSATHDGRAAGSLTGQSVDADGFVVFTYSNGDTKKGPNLALARFNSSHVLQQVGAGDLTCSDPSAVTLVHAGKESGQTIKPGEIELSNVAISEAFGELIMAQRAYQSASRVVTTVNQMLDDLMNAKGGR